MGIFSLISKPHPDPRNSVDSITDRARNDMKSVEGP